MLHVWQANLQGDLRVWHPDSDTWTVVANWQTMRDAYNDKAVCLYAPSQLILHLVSTLSLSQLKQLGSTGQQYLFEDIALTPVEQLRVRNLGSLVSQSVNGDDAQERHLFYAASINDITAWNNVAELAGFDIAALVPDFLLLPVPDIGEGTLQGTTATLYHDADTTLLRQSKNQGFAVSYIPALMGRLLLGSMPNLQEVTLLPQAILSNQANLDISPADLNQASQASQKVSGSFNELASILAQDDISVYTSTKPLTPITSPQRHPLNFIEKTSQSKLSPYLKVAMVTALCAGVLQMSADALHIYQYKQATAQVAEATNAQFSSWVAGESLNPNVGVPTQTRPYLVAGGEAMQSTQLATLSRIAPLIRQSAITAQALSWDNQSLTLRLVSPQRQSLDVLVSALVEQGVNASLGTIEPFTEDSVVGEVRVTLTPEPDAA